MSIVCLISICSACQTTFVVPVNTIVCTNSNESCVLSHAAVMKLSMNKPVACLHLKYEQMLVKELKVQLKRVLLRCRKVGSYFSRDTHTSVEFVKRCARMGSCNDRKCAGVGPQTHMAELSTANSYPGITYCAESCGGIGCNCFFPSPDCLFYRVYHKHTDDRVHEVFSCPVWEQLV